VLDAILVGAARHSSKRFQQFRLARSSSVIRIVNADERLGIDLQPIEVGGELDKELILFR
jgi:hypothetical protein